MDVFGIGEVDEEGEYAAERSPVAEDSPGEGVLRGEEVREEGGEGCKAVWTIERDFGTGADGTAADVEEDEGGDDD